MDCCSSSSSSLGVVGGETRGWFPRRCGSSKKQHQMVVPRPGVRASLTANMNNSRKTTTSYVEDPFACIVDSFNVSCPQSPISPENLDVWVQNSVTEIVRNIEEAPFLMHVYSENKKNTLFRTSMVTESWPDVQRRWKQGSPIPDGVILVQQLNKDDTSSTKAWGLLIQGRGVDRAACYILKTCRVSSCTHFCLVKAKCFGDSAQLQFNHSWTISPS